MPDYCIPEGYNARIGATQDFEGESRMQDGWQKEVYETARQIADEQGYKHIVDVGTGSGYKLVKFFPLPPFNTVGIDLLPAIEFLRRNYPERVWDTNCEEGTELLICSDAIEHVDDPDALCEYIKSLKPKHIVISTPDRDLVCKFKGQPPLGPPRNTCHVREWNFKEFGDYLSTHFVVERLFYSNESQYTMCAIARLK